MFNNTLDRIADRRTDLLVDVFAAGSEATSVTTDGTPLMTCGA